MWLPTLKVTGAGKTSFVGRLEKIMQEKPELKVQIMDKENPEQLSFEF